MAAATVTAATTSEVNLDRPKKKTPESQDIERSVQKI